MSRKEITKNRITKKNIPIDEDQIESQVVEIFPYGLITGLSQEKPIFLFKDKDEKDFLPVWLDPSEVETIHQILHPHLTKNHPYITHVKIFEKLKTRISSCSFNKYDGYRLYADLELNGETAHSLMQERAEDVVCLALAAKASFFTTMKVLEACREIKDFEKLKELEQNIGNFKTTQTYLM